MKQKTGIIKGHIKLCTRISAGLQLEVRMGIMMSDFGLALR